MRSLIYLLLMITTSIFSSSVLAYSSDLLGQKCGVKEIINHVYDGNNIYDIKEKCLDKVARSKCSMRVIVKYVSSDMSEDEIIEECSIDYTSRKAEIKDCSVDKCVKSSSQWPLAK